MTILIEAFEAHGAAVSGHAQYLTKVTNCNLKTGTVPEQHYFQYDIQRPTGTIGLEQINWSYPRYFTFKVTGDYNRIKNLRIELPDGTEEDYLVRYALRETYVQPGGTVNEFGKVNGQMDGSLIPTTGETVLFPKTYQGANLAAPTWSRPVNWLDGDPVWTQYLVLQFGAKPSTYDNVGNFGLELVKVYADEIE